jgi:DNA-binding PadR family transcriptional regulator
MSLPHALLTALAERPCSGLELAGRFDRSIGYFWSATHQQIYRELGRLEAAGWVESASVEQSRGRKRNYRLLPAGRKELKRWVLEGGDPKPVRDEMMVRLRAEAVLGPVGLEQEMRRRLALHEEKLAVYRQIEAKDFADGDASRETQLRHIVLQAGIMQETLWIELARKALKVLALPG